MSHISHRRALLLGALLAAGLVAFGAGLLVAALVPASDAESRASQKLVDTAKEHGQPVVDQAKAAGQELAEGLKGPATDAVQEVKGAALIEANEPLDLGSISVTFFEVPATAWVAVHRPPASMSTITTAIRRMGRPPGAGRVFPG